MGNGNGHGIAPDKIRPWVLLIVAVILIVYSLIAPDPTILMLGCTMLGTEPLAQAKKQPAPNGKPT